MFIIDFGQILGVVIMVVGVIIGLIIYNAFEMKKQKFFTKRCIGLYDPDRLRYNHTCRFNRSS